MTRRLTLAAVGAAALILLAAAPAFAMRATASEPFGWVLQLRNTVTSRYSSDMTYTTFAAWATGDRQVTIVDNNKTPSDPSDDVSYKGVSLKTLVGYFDDNDPSTFNTALAVAGYNVKVEGMDGFTATFASADVASLGDEVIVANLANDEPLVVPKAALDKNGQPGWKPNWPLKVVSNESSVTGKMKPGGVVRVSIVPAVAPASAAAEPFGWDLQLRNTKTTKYSADMTSTAFAAWAAKAHRLVTITDSTVPTSTVTYTGVSLKTMVGYFDDKNPKTFNAKLAKKGYSVVVLGMDGYSATWASADIASLGSKVILASLANGAPLPVPAAFLQNGQPTWVPDWPLRIVSMEPSVSVNSKVQGVLRLSIVPTVAPTGAAPF